MFLLPEYVNQKKSQLSFLFLFLPSFFFLFLSFLFLILVPFRATCDSVLSCLNGFATMLNHWISKLLLSFSFHFQNFKDNLNDYGEISRLSENFFFQKKKRLKKKIKNQKKIHEVSIRIHSYVSRSFVLTHLLL